MVRKGVRVVEARRVYAIFELWRTVDRERERIQGAGATATNCQSRGQAFSSFFPFHSVCDWR
jgi:hypothetical protein